MTRNKIILLTLLLICSSLSINAQSKQAKTKSQTVAKKVSCKSNDVLFPCPKGYKILLNGDDSGGVFLARNSEYGYGVFVVELKDSSENLADETKYTLLKKMYPKELQSYRWKTSEFVNNNDSSKFEVGKSLLIGFNGSQIVTIESRRISFDNKNIIVGTVVEGFEKGAPAQEEFNEGLYTANSGCFDALKIIHSITKEKFDEESNPCRIILEIQN